MMTRISEPNVIAKLNTEANGIAALTSTHVRSIDSARAAENIAEWRKYLPQDCVNAMIKAGWHGTV